MQNSKSIPRIGTTDKLLLVLDQGPVGALYRGLIGFVTIPAMRLLSGGDGYEWTLVPFFLFILLLLRVGLAIVRKVVGFSLELQEAWAVRRRMAKLYDSYQWRKLMWIGAGMALYVVVSDSYRAVPVALSVFCLITGAAAGLRWRVVSVDSRFPKPRARKIKTATP